MSSSFDNNKPIRVLQNWDNYVKQFLKIHSMQEKQRIFNKDNMKTVQ